MPKDRSVGAALVLTFFFGPLGLLYVSVLGGLLMTVVWIVVAIFTLGVGLIVLWPITMVWAAISASNKHSRHQAWLGAQSRPDVANIPPTPPEPPRSQNPPPLPQPPETEV
jgi:hypothetical protein